MKIVDRKHRVDLTELDPGTMISIRTDDSTIDGMVVEGYGCDKCVLSNSRYPCSLFILSCVRREIMGISDLMEEL